MSLFIFSPPLFILLCRHGLLPFQVSVHWSIWSVRLCWWCLPLTGCYGYIAFIFHVAGTLCFGTTTSISLKTLWKKLHCTSVCTFNQGTTIYRITLLTNLESSVVSCIMPDFWHPFIIKPVWCTKMKSGTLFYLITWNHLQNIVSFQFVKKKWK